MITKLIEKRLLILVSLVIMLVPMTSCSKDSDDDEDDRPAQYTIEGANPIGKDYTTYTVTGVPSGAFVKWSVSDSRFVLSQNGHNSTMIKATQSGVEATLTAKILRGEELVGWLTKAITSQY